MATCSDRRRGSGSTARSASTTRRSRALAVIRWGPKRVRCTACGHNGCECPASRLGRRAYRLPAVPDASRLREEISVHCRGLATPSPLCLQPTGAIERLRPARGTGGRRLGERRVEGHAADLHSDLPHLILTRRPHPHLRLIRPPFRDGFKSYSSSINALASFRSRVSNPSVNQPCIDWIAGSSSATHH